MKRFGQSFLRFGRLVAGLYCAGLLLIVTMGASDGWWEWRRGVDRNIKYLLRQTADPVAGDPKDPEWQKTWKATKKRHGIQDNGARSYSPEEYRRYLERQKRGRASSSAKGF